MSNTRAWLAQCLCPQRHCILASAGEASDQASAETDILEALRQTVHALLSRGTINPWCDLCQAHSDAWTYALGRTPYFTMAEAMPHLQASERAQQESKRLLRRSQN